MRAQILDSYQEGKLTLREVPKPSPRPGEVLIRIVASGVNPIDCKVRKGLSPYAMPELPAILGTDMAGVIEEVGADVSGFALGDEVFGLVGGVWGMPGTLADYVAVDVNLVARKPKTLSMRESAALPLVTLTAWEGLVDRAGVQAGQKALILGGSGGVGHVAIQIAKARGAEVFATAAPEKFEMIHALGAVALDRSLPIEEHMAQHTNGAGFDIVYATIGGPVLADALKAVTYYGHVVSCAAFGTVDLTAGSLRAATLSGVFVLLPMTRNVGRARHGEILREVASLADRGALKPIVDPRRFTLEQAMEAHKVQETGHPVAKIVIDISHG